MNRADELAAAASKFIGVAFRLSGRDPTVGLDCIGLVVASLRAIGIQVADPAGYALRNRAIGRWLKCAGQSSLTLVRAPIERGDVLMVRTGPQQHHVLIADTPATAIHAHAGLRRVVRQPLAKGQRVEAHWRLIGSASKEL